MEYKTVLVIVMLAMYFINSMIWFEIIEMQNTNIFQIWMRELAIVVTLFALLVLIVIHVVQKISLLDTKNDGGVKC